MIRGANVTSGYLDDPAANAAAFTQGWFRTGDQGYLDTDGYLFITGRLKEIINRGGEKIAPREVDEILLTHPAVAQAVTFGVSHPTLGRGCCRRCRIAPGAIGNGFTDSPILVYAIGRLQNSQPSRDRR